MTDGVSGLPAIPGGWTEQTVRIADKAYQLTLPASPDALLDDPTVRALNERDDYMPYWPFLWPAAHPMAVLVARHAWQRGAASLEIGCGIGLVGLAALDRGLDVVFSDYQQDAVDLALFNARRNGHASPRGALLDWRHPTESHFAVIFGSDVVYERRSHAPILSLVQRSLLREGTAWFGDAGRQHAAAFIGDARSRGFQVELRDEEGHPITEPHVGRFQLIVLTAGPALRPAHGLQTVGLGQS